MPLGEEIPLALRFTDLLLVVSTADELPGGGGVTNIDDLEQP